jgi:hypothetical protein
MKIDDHTTNSSSLKKSIEKLQENAKKYGSVPLLINFLEFVRFQTHVSLKILNKW